LTAKVIDKLSLPNPFAIGSLQAGDAPPHADHKEMVPVNGWRSTGAFFGLRHTLFDRITQLGTPDR
jgi:hypothetical protein